MYPAARRQEDARARSLREESTLQARRALPRRHRRAYLGAVPRSRHEALSRRGQRALRAIGRCCRARQQFDDHCFLAGETIVAQTKRRLTAPSSLRSHSDDVSSFITSAAPTRLAPENAAAYAVQNATQGNITMASTLKILPSPHKIHAFRDRNYLVLMKWNPGYMSAPHSY